MDLIKDYDKLIDLVGGDFMSFFSGCGIICFICVFCCIIYCITFCCICCNGIVNAKWEVSSGEPVTYQTNQQYELHTPSETKTKNI